MGVIKEFQGEHRFLSNFWPSKVLPPTLEHHYQAAKGLFWSEQVMKQEGPGMAKKIGREFPSKSWYWVKEQIMLELVRQKFQEPVLREKLLATGGDQLIEGNRWHDNFWGVCSCGTLRCLAPGQNMLGKILMQVRDEMGGRR